MALNYGFMRLYSSLPANLDARFPAEIPPDEPTLTSR
jgi:hypothetical protein